MRTGTCLKVLAAIAGKMFSFRDTDGTRAKGRRANCSREIPFNLEGMPPLSPGVKLTQTRLTTNQTIGVTVMARQNNIMREHNVLLFLV